MLRDTNFNEHVSFSATTKVVYDLALVRSPLRPRGRNKPLPRGPPKYILTYRAL